VQRLQHVAEQLGQRPLGGVVPSPPSFTGVNPRRSSDETRGHGIHGASTHPYVRLMAYEPAVPTIIRRPERVAAET
jgi:hypothetical protein